MSRGARPAWPAASCLRPECGHERDVIAYHADQAHQSRISLEKSGNSPTTLKKLLGLSPYPEERVASRRESVINGPIVAGAVLQTPSLLIEIMFTSLYLSHVTCHLSPVTCHVSHAMCHMSHVTCDMSYLKTKKSLQSGQTCRLRVCYQQGPTPSS